MNRIVALALGLLAASPLAAQDQDWRFKVMGYLWLPTTNVGVSTPRGTVSAELSVSDALDALDFALMGNFEARRDRLSFGADLVYLNVSAGADTPFGGLFNTVDVGTKITAFTAIAAYSVHQTDRFTLDVGAGARAFWTDIDVTLSGGILPTESTSRTDQWVDPIIVMRGKYDFDEKWFGTFYLDVGGFGVSSESTHQAALGLGYNLNESWSLSGGWRYLDLERENGANTLDFRQSGVMLGASYNF